LTQVTVLFFVCTINLLHAYIKNYDQNVELGLKESALINEYCYDNNFTFFLSNKPYSKHCTIWHIDI